MLTVYTKVDEIRNKIAQLALMVATAAANEAGDKMQEHVTKWEKESFRRFKDANAAETALANKEAAGNFFGISKRITITPAFSFA